MPKIRFQELLQELNALSSQRDHGGSLALHQQNKTEKGSHPEAHDQAVVAKGQEVAVPPSPLTQPASQPSLPPSPELLPLAVDPGSILAVPAMMKDGSPALQAMPDTSRETSSPPAAFGEEARARVDGPDVANKAQGADHALNDSKQPVSGLPGEAKTGMQHGGSDEQAAASAAQITVPGVAAAVEHQRDITTAPSQMQQDGNMPAAIHARASADIIQSWRASKRDVQATLKELQDVSSARARSTLSSQSQDAPPSLNRIGSAGIIMVQNSSFQEPNVSVGNFTGLFDAAAVIFPESAEPPQVILANPTPIHVPSTIVQRVIGKLSGMRLRELLPGDRYSHFASAGVSQDGNELLWTRPNGAWRSLFVRGVINVTLGSAAADEGGSRTSLADDCVFQVDLPHRSFAFEAETPYLLQLWVVGLLVLLESSASVLSTVHIWSSLAPRLLQTSSAAYQPGRFALAPSVEHFMSELQHIQASPSPHRNSSPAAPVAEPLLMAATLERRVECAGHAVLLLPTVAKLGEHCLSLSEPDSDVEFATCDFSQTGTKLNSVEFASQLRMEQSTGAGSHPAVMTPCMEIKDSFGACHVLLLPSQEVAADWHTTVGKATALSGTASSTCPQPSGPVAVAENGVNALLKSLDFSVAMRSFHHALDLSQGRSQARAEVREGVGSPFFAGVEGGIGIENTEAVANGSTASNTSARDALSTSSLKLAASSEAPLSLPFQYDGRPNRGATLPIEREEHGRHRDAPSPAPAPIAPTHQHLHSPHTARSPGGSPFFVGVGGGIGLQSQSKSPIAELQSTAYSAPASPALFRAQSHPPTPRIPTATERSPPSHALNTVPSAPSRYGGRIQEHPTIGVGRSVNASPITPTPAPATSPATLSLFSTASQRFVTVVDSDAGGTGNQPSAAAVAARINGALAAFAKFGK